MLSINEETDTTHLLHFSYGMQGQCGLSTALRAKDLQTGVHSNRRLVFELSLCQRIIAGGS